MIRLINMALAEDGVAILEPSIIGGANTSAGISFVSYMARLTSIFFMLVIIGAVIMIVIGGLQYILSGAAGSKGEAKSRIGGAIWGLLLALAAVLILNTINPELVTFRLF